MSMLALALGALVWPSSALGAGERSGQQPHIIFIVADDLGWHDVGFRNHGQIRTPNIDGLAKDGLILDQYYVQAVCSPSRATFMTGRLPVHHTVNDWLRDGTATSLPLNETLIPRKLVNAGYRAHMRGKWHLGFTKWAHTPTFRGFESFVGFYTGGEDYFTHEAQHTYDFRRDMQPNCGKNCSNVAWQDQGRYSTHVFTEEAVRVIKEHEASKAPLFLYLAYQAVHAPSQVPDSYRDAYNATIADLHRRIFAGMLSCMDEGIGNVTAALQQKGMLENSLIVFTTDNGGPIVGTPGGDYAGSTNYPLRGGKHSIWEGGTRGTAVVWAGFDTGLVPASRRGTTLQQLMHGADWFPTFCSVAGISDSCAELPLDGVDQSGPLFHNSTSKRTEIFYGRKDDAPEKFNPYDTALRDAQGWKLVQRWGGLPDAWSQPTNVSGAVLADERSTPSQQDAVLLFNLAEDPSERHEVSAKHPDVVKRLLGNIDSMRASAVDVVGGGGHPDPACPTYDPKHFVDPHVGPVWEPWCDHATEHITYV